MSEEKKKFKDRKLVQWVKDKFPDVLDIAGDITGIDALNRVSDMITGKPELSQADRLEFMRMKQEFELELLRAENSDRDSARKRESEIAKATGKTDWMQRLVGIIGLLLLVTIVCYALFSDIKNPEQFAHVKGLIEGVGLAIFTYYFGTSGGSKQKQAIIERLVNK